MQAHERIAEMSNTTIDRTTFAELQDTAGVEFVNELVAAFFVEAPLMLAELRDAFGAQSAERFRRAAHSVKSNSLTFGASALASLARDLELGGLPAQAIALDALDLEYARVAAALQELSRG